MVVNKSIQPLKITLFLIVFCFVLFVASFTNSRTADALTMANVANYSEIDSFPTFGASFEADAPINGKNGWVASGGATTVDVAEFPQSNLALSLTGDDQWAYKSLGNAQIADKGTVFFRIARLGSADAFAGVSASSNPTQFSDFEAQFGSTPSQLGSFTIRDGSSAVQPSNTSPFEDGQWYCVWLHIDAQTDTYEAAAMGGFLNSPTKLRNNNNLDFDFRNGTSNSLSTFFVRSGNHDGELQIDHIYVDPSQHTLNNPSGYNCITGEQGDNFTSTLEDFELLSNGPLDGQRGWAATSGAVVTQDPHDPQNKVLQISGQDQRAFKLLHSEIDSQGTGAVSFFMKRAGNVDVFAGVSHQDSPSNFSDFEVQFGSNASTTNNFTLRDQNIFRQTTEQFPDGNSESHWSCVTIPLDNANNQFSVYIRDLNGNNKITIDGSDTYQFRNGTTDPLKSFLVLTGLDQGIFYIDEIWFNNYTSLESIYYSDPCLDLTCPGFPMNVANEGQLNNAIGCFNNTSSGDYQINLTTSFSLTTNLVPIDNASSASLTINGDDSVIDGNDQWRIFDVQAGQVTISRIVLTEGHMPQWADYCLDNSNYTDCAGGAMYIGSAANVNLYKTTISDSRASRFGGGIYLDGGNLTVRDSIIRNNWVSNDYEEPVYGGGIYVSDGTVLVENSTFSNNGVSVSGGWPHEGAGLYIDSGDVTINNSVIRDNDGTGITNNGNLIANKVYIQNNITDSGPGGVFNGSAGDVTLSNSNVSNNIGYFNTGGVLNLGSMTIDATTIDNNNGLGAGGVSNRADLSISNSTLSRNSSGDNAGGVSNSGNLDISNSTISENQGNGDGAGGVINEGVVTISNSTVVGNTAFNNEAGSGIRNETSGEANPPTITLSNTLVQNFKNSSFTNTGNDFDCQGTISASSNNIDTDGSCDNATTRTQAEINLGPLQDNGGPTETNALLVGSLAIDAGTSDPAITTDQRGLARPEGNAPDIGAFESKECTATSFDVTNEIELNEAIGCFSFGPVGSYTINVSDDINLSTNTLTIDGAEGSQLTIHGHQNFIDGNGIARILNIQDNHVTISNLVIKNGRADTIYCATGQFECGGGVYVGSSATVTITQSTVDGNFAPQYGGGVFNEGTLLIDKSTISNNTIFANLFLDEDQPPNLPPSTGLYLDGTPYGAGIHNHDGSIVVQNSTISGNQGIWDGGGFFNFSGTAEINNSTIADNQSWWGGGLYNRLGTVTLNNSLIVNNTASQDPSTGNCFNSATLISNGSNIDTDGSCSSSTTKTSNEVNLGPLQDNGGPTLTHNLLTGSAAIDAGVSDPDITTDQRGASRPEGSAPDVGALESIVCSGVSFDIANESELNDAIDCFNFGPAGSYSINITADVVLTQNTSPIDGAGGSQLAILGNGNSIDGNYLARALNIQDNNVTISNLTIKNGFADKITCAYAQYTCGGGMYVGPSAVVSIIESTVDNNFALQYGGGIFNDGTLLIDKSTVSNNKIYALFLDEDQAPDSPPSSSPDEFDGTPYGAGVLNYNGSIVIQNSTISGNRGIWDGGGFYNFSGSAEINYSTITDNSTWWGGGVYNRLGTVTIDNSLIVNNTASQDVTKGDCFNTGTLTASGFNIDTDGSCDNATTKTSGEVNLGPLQDNGGPTFTHDLLLGSHAIDAADITACVAAPINGKDQRDIDRPQGVTCDVGSVEFDGPFVDDWIFNNGGGYVDGSESQIQVTGTGTNWSAQFWRKDGSTFGGGNRVSFDFYVDQKNSKTYLSVLKEGGNYERFALADIGGNLKVNIYRPGETVPSFTQELLSSSEFQANTWYSASITIDDQYGSFITVEQRDDPSVSGSFRDTDGLLSTGSQWSFFGIMFQNSVFLDNYLEEAVTLTPPPADDWIFRNDSGAYVPGSNSQIQVNGTGTNWKAQFLRKDESTFGSGNRVSFDFYVDQKDSKTHLSVVKEGGSYERLALIDVGGTLKVGIYRPGEAVPNFTQQLLSSTEFQANTWYSASITIDDQYGSFITVEQRDDPSISGSFRDTDGLLSTGNQWSFFGIMFQNSVFLDNYLEEAVTLTPPPADDWTFRNDSGGYVPGSNSQIQVNGTGINWKAQFLRKDQSTFGSGNQVSFDFYVDQKDSKTHLSVVKEGGSFERFALVDAGGGLRVSIYRPDEAVPNFTQQLLSSTEFQANTWYSVTMTIDDVNGSQIEVEQRDDPSVNGLFQDTAGLLSTGNQWSFFGIMFQHSVFVDNYVEGAVLP